MSGQQSGTATIAVSNLRVGIILPAPIFDAANNRLLLNCGVQLTVGQIEKLSEQGVKEVTVEEQFAKSLETPGGGKPAQNMPAIHRTSNPAGWTPEVIRNAERQRQNQATLLKSMYQALETQRRINAGALGQIATECISQLSVDLDLFVKLAIAPRESNEEHEHCLRITHLAIAVANAMGCTLDELKWLGIGCLAHRAGATPIARQLALLNRQLTMIELTEIKKTPVRVFDLLSRDDDIPSVSRLVAYQINERWDGSGYPRGRVGAQIHPLARVAGLCNAYVALASPRPHRPALSLYEAVRHLLTDTGRGVFDPTTVRAFLQTVSLYPLGSYVRLSSGSIARVVRSSSDSYDRPVVEILDGSPSRIVALAETPDIRVVEFIDPAQAKELLAALPAPAPAPGSAPVPGVEPSSVSELAPAIAG